MVNKTTTKENYKVIPDFTIYLDAEWGPENKPVSVQLEVELPDQQSLSYIVINKSYKESLDLDVISHWEESNSTKIIFLPITSSTNIVDHVLKNHYLPKIFGGDFSNHILGGKVYLFYSFQDLGFAFGWENLEKQLHKELKSKGRDTIDQKRGLSGVIKISHSDQKKTRNWKICDLYGLGNTSLKKTAQSLGLDIVSKDELDDLKSQMDVALLTRTNTFLDYALGDVLILKQIFQNYLSFSNEILVDTLGLPISMTFTKENIPLTTGSFVSRTFEKYIHFHASKDSAELSKKLDSQVGNVNVEDTEFHRSLPHKLALWSLSSLKRQGKNRERFLKSFNKIFGKKGVQNVYKTVLEDYKEIQSWETFRGFEIPPYSGASIETLGLNDFRSTSILNCLVSGGRANNEMPFEYEVENILDVDLQSCYGSALTKFDFPVGFPTVIAYCPNEEHMTLGQFLKKYRSELIPGLYKITVSGKLSFEQDLLFSKVVSLESMKKALSDFSEKHAQSVDDATHFSSDFILSRKELFNAVITEDLLEILKNVATSREFNDSC